TYKYPKLVIFSGSVTSACGEAEAAMGPFYCSGDDSVYIDLSWYEELAANFSAPGDFAQAYVIAHEVGHHVQNQLGILDEVHRAMGATSQEKANELSVRLELQADFFAGVWAHYADRSRDLLERGDLEEALRAASAVGDDTIQKRTRGYVVPDSFTHGSAAQRLKYFKLGYETGDLEAFDLL
ncbi:MAG TPA: neutral zinc metallopeptidase, partial [Spirochaetales bacterium]|nr:neutral zinc metallopeptidase [Spirochaetales bacterium]